LNLAPTRKEFPPKAQSEKYKKYEIIFQAKDNPNYNSSNVELSVGGVTMAWPSALLRPPFPPAVNVGGSWCYKFQIWRRI
jgi:hypothetical protein